MSINRRTAIAVRSIGVASAAAALALGVAGSAFACHISEFKASAGCDDAHHGYITVVDSDDTTAVDITVSQGSKEVGSQTGVTGSRDGKAFTFAVEWAPSAVYSVHVTQSASRKEVGTTTVTTPDKACAADTPPATPPTTPAGTTPTTPAASQSAAPTPSASTSAPAAAVADTNAPKPAA
ncbi:MAG: hypothetical protein HOY69_12170, partial [Streptomyces sp.]|nr:hypothetical protein [Streptomyces sp.]